jgi:RHS repeat-associated protein
VTPANSEAFTYTPSHRLASASGAYGSLSWTYDADGNRTSQVVGSATQTYAYPTTSNLLSSIAQSGASTRSFGYDASGDRSSDTVGSSSLSEAYDGDGRLIAFQNGSSVDGAYVYDAFSRLAQRVVSNVTPSGTTQYLYDPYGHVVLETDGAGNSLREYIWLDDMPVAIIDQVNTASPILYYVHADHLDRPVMVTNGAGASVWSAVWTPFGSAQSITGSLAYNARFPGQWFQIESGLHWNWHRHYDPSTGTYIQPDPYSKELTDQTQAGALSGAPYTTMFAASPLVGLDDMMTRSGAASVVSDLPTEPRVAADLLGQIGDPTKGSVLGNVVFADGPNRYGYAAEASIARTDLSGLATNIYGEPNTSSWESTSTLRFFGPDGRAAFDVDCPGTHGFLELNVWSWDPLTGEPSRGKEKIAIPY